MNDKLFNDEWLARRINYIASPNLTLDQADDSWGTGRVTKALM